MNIPPDPLPPDPSAPTSSVPDHPSPPRPARRRLASIGLGLLGVLGLLAVLYAALFGYQFVQTQLGAFAPLAAVLGLGLLLAILAPILLVRYHLPLETALAW